MSPRPVEAVFFWRYLKSPFRATYGRLSGTLYSKDFLQSPGEQWPVIDKVLKRPSGGKVSVVYRWPTGTVGGEWRQSAADTRGQLAWQTNNAPLPWKIGNPSADVAATIPGDPSKASEVQAEQELEGLASKNLDPWILAIKLHGEDGVLHARAYLGAPPNGLEKLGVQTLPAVLKKAIENLPGGQGGGALELGIGATVRSRRLVEKVMSTLKRDPNILLVGPPGTGKTVALEDLMEVFENPAGVFFDPTKWEDAWSESFELPGSEKKVLSLVFHPSYTYEDFTAKLVPKTEDGNLNLEARPGPFLSLAHWAQDPNRQALLLIDEFNRGSAAAIFGDTLALLDAGKRHDPARGQVGARILRPYPDQKMKVDGAFTNRAKGDVLDSEITLPAGVWIVAAQNSTDRSVAPLDAALRRRFAIVFVGPDYAALAERLGVTFPSPHATFTPSNADPGSWTAEDIGQLAIRLLIRLNERIEAVLGPDFLLGHALLWAVSGGTPEEVGRSLCYAFDERIAASLRMTFVDQDEALAAILRVSAYGTAESMIADRIAVWQEPPSGLSEVASPRLHINSISDWPLPKALSALQALL